MPKNYEKDNYDYFCTPSWCTKALLAHSPDYWYRNRIIVEPGAGTHAISNVLKAEKDPDYIYEVDVNPDYDYGPKEGGEFMNIDFTDLSAVTTWLAEGVHVKPEVVVMNPPFKYAAKFIDHARLCAPIVCALLRWTWLEPCADRAEFLNKFPPNRVIVLPRPKFKGNGADQATAAWFCWVRGEDYSKVHIVSPKEAAEYGRPYKKSRKGYTFVSMEEV